MAHKKRPKVKVEVSWRASDGTAVVDTFTAHRAYSTVIPNGPAVVRLVHGRDEHGPVAWGTYGKVDRILHRPVKRRGGR